MIGIDEISYCKGHKYATIVYDLERSCVVWVGKGKARETIDSFFRNKLSRYQRKRIVSGCCDMSETFIGAIEKWCPKATLVLDRFHIVRLSMRLLVRYEKKNGGKQIKTTERP